MPKVNNHDDKKWAQNMDMLIAYGLHRGGGPGSCDVHTKTSVVNGATGDLLTYCFNHHYPTILYNFISLYSSLFSFSILSFFDDLTAFNRTLFFCYFS